MSSLKFAENIQLDIADIKKERKAKFQSKLKKPAEPDQGPKQNGSTKNSKTSNSE